ncbi:MAG TPA: ATP-binding protein [Candidatus Limnocylindria bacterium]|nr:ATP-binding protein [Candidatus Limnocylindria bacterium]
MTAIQLIQGLTNVSFLLVFLAVLVRAIRRPSRESIDIALFFGAPAISITQNWVTQALGIRDPTLSLISGALILAMPLLTLRAIQGFTDLPRLVVPAAGLTWALTTIALLGVPSPMPQPLVLLILVYFVVFEGYAGFAVLRATRRAHGVTRRRLQLIAAGTLFLAVTILGAGVAIVLPLLGAFILPLALCSGLAYLLGFAPPGPLRRAWQAPEVFAFVRRTNRLVGEAAPELVYVTLARELATAMGEPEVGLGIWQPEGEVLRYWRNGRPVIDRTIDESLAAQAFVQQRAIVTSDHAAGKRLPTEYRALGRQFVLAAPVSVGARRIGVIGVLVAKRTAFFDDDLGLLQLLADQAGVVLEHRRLFEEVHELNRTLERNVSELRALNDELAAFAYSVSHDLRAPLRSIDGFSQILLEDKGAELGDDGRQHLERVRAAATRMGTLIDDMLLLSRITRDEMKPRIVDLTALASSVVEELRAREPQRQVEFESNGVLPARGDERLLRIALMNLLGNAWKFTRARQPAHVSFGGETRDGEAVFFVKDDGAGFDMRYAQKLFGAFQRLHNTAEFEGTGIGLATVKRIVHRHGGRVWAESEVDKGTTFYFSLPLAAVLKPESNS